jgi:hypothetical protein
VSRFDSDALLQAATDQIVGMGPELVSAVLDSTALRTALLRLREDAAATLRAIEQETDPVKLANLQQDLAQMLPARRKIIVSLAKSYGGASLEDVAERGLRLLGQVVVAAARAFVLRA